MILVTLLSKEITGNNQKGGEKGGQKRILIHELSKLL